MTPTVAGSIGPANAPMPAEDALTANLSLMTDYLSGDLTPEEMAAVDDRLDTDDAFFNDVAPLTIAWHAPQPFLEKGGLKKVGTELSEAEQQAQWDSLESPPTRSDPSPNKWGRRAVILLVAVVSAVSGAIVMKIRDAWPYAVADYRAGRALAPGASFWRPDMYQTGSDQEQWVALPTADVHLNSMSRLSIGWKSIGAIDGEADVVVHEGQKLALWVGDVPFIFSAGRYRVEHPLGPKARIRVYSGTVRHRLDTYGAGTVITAESHETKTTITAQDADGRLRPPVTLTNNAIRP